jgi:hypothetical protein
MRLKQKEMGRPEMDENEKGRLKIREVARSEQQQVKIRPAAAAAAAAEETAFVLVTNLHEEFSGEFVFFAVFGRAGRERSEGRLQPDLLLQRLGIMDHHQSWVVVERKREDNVRLLRNLQQSAKQKKHTIESK